MVEKVKADFKKHWVSWVGFIGLVAIFCHFFFHNPNQLLMAILFWVLVVWGMSIEAAYDKQYNYRTSEEMNKPYE